MNACQAPIRQGPRTGLPATGSNAGYQRHHRAGEPACSECLAAVTAAASERYRANPETKRQQSAQRYLENREKLLAQTRRWQEANRDKVNAIARRWREAHPEETAAANRRFRENHPEAVRESSRIRRARKAAALTISFTREQLADRMAVWGNQCWMCGGVYEEVDHVIPIALGGPHCLSNLRPACRSCNASKGARPLAAVE